MTGAADGDARAFAAACSRTGLTVEQVWLRYFELGGLADPFEIDAFLNGLVPLTGGQRDVLAHALNERLADINAVERLPYTFEHSRE